VSGHVSADGPATSRSRVAIASALVATAPLLDDDESMADYVREARTHLFNVRVQDYKLPDVLPPCKRNFLLQF
jgi:hypothetical protein